MSMSEDIIQGPEANKVIANYKSNQYKEAIEFMEAKGKLKSDLAKQFKNIQHDQHNLLEALADEEELENRYRTRQEESFCSDQHFGVKLQEMTNTILQQRVNNLEASVERLMEEQRLAYERLVRQKDEDLAKIKAEYEAKKATKNNWKDICGQALQFGIKVAIPWILRRIIL